MATCKGCGREIVWGKKHDGGMVPLDPRAPVFAVDTEGEAYSLKSQLDIEGRLQMALPNGQCALVRAKWMVSHFATCPNANEFSGKNKSKEATNEQG